MFIFIPIAILWGLSSGLRSILVFNWITFMRPQDFTYTFWNTKPMFRVSLILMFLSLIVHRKIKLSWNGFLVLYIIFYLWILFCALNGFSKYVTWNYFQSYIMITPIAFCLLSWSIHNIDEIKKVLWVMAGCVGLISAKTALSMAITGNFTLRENANGFVGDNNTLALCVCLCASILMGLKESLKNFNSKLIVYFVLILCCLLILMTQSRGAFITLGVISLIAIITSKRPILYFIIVVFIIGVGYLSLPKTMFSRLGTLHNVEADGSAMGRVEMWKRAIKIVSVDPVTGIGLGCFNFYNSVMYPGQTNLVTHSVYFQILAGTGIPGLLIYLTIIFYSISTLHKSYINCRKYAFLLEQLNWAGQTAFWMRNALIGYVVGSAFLDMFVYDVPWYFLFYSQILSTAINSEVKMISSEELQM